MASTDPVAVEVSKVEGLSAASVLREGKASKSKLSQFLNKPGIVELIVTPVILVVGVIVGIAGEGLDFIDALYLNIQYITTIGYGDIVPENNATRVFLAFYVMTCLILVAHYMGSVVGAVSDYMSTKMTTAMSSGSLGKIGCNKPLAVSSVLLLVMILFGMIFYGALEKCSCSFGVSAAPGCDGTSYDTCVASGGFTKDYVQTFYMSVITLTTVGLGDYTPDSEAGRWVSILWMMIGTAVCGTWVGNLSSFFFDRQQAAKQQEVALRAKDLFKSMDGDSDGYLQKAEHHLYLLTLHGVVTADMLETLEKDFTKLSSGQTGVSYEQLKSETSP